MRLSQDEGYLGPGLGEGLCLRRDTTYLGDGTPVSIVISVNVCSTCSSSSSLHFQKCHWSVLNLLSAVGSPRQHTEHGD